MRSSALLLCIYVYITSILIEKICERWSTQIFRKKQLLWIITIMGQNISLCKSKYINVLIQ